MKFIKCLKIAPETICEQLKKSYQPVVISGVELDLNELASTLIENLLERVTVLQETIREYDEDTCENEIQNGINVCEAEPKLGRLIASYLITT